MSVPIEILLGRVTVDVFIATTLRAAPNSVEAVAVRKFAQHLREGGVGDNSHSIIVEQHDILREALELIAGERGSCEGFTTGPMSCKKAGRRRIARYSADRWCDRCIANDALDRAIEAGKPATP